MFCHALWMSGDVKGLLCCSDTAKVKSFSTLNLVSQYFYLESLPFLKLPNIYVKPCHVCFRSDLFWNNMGFFEEVYRIRARSSFYGKYGRFSSFWGLYMYVYMFVYIMYMYMYIYAHVCMCVCIYTYTCTWYFSVLHRKRMA